MGIFVIAGEQARSVETPAPSLYAMACPLENLIVRKRRTVVSPGRNHDWKLGEQAFHQDVGLRDTVARAAGQVVAWGQALAVGNEMDLGVEAASTAPENCFRGSRVGGPAAAYARTIGLSTSPRTGRALLRLDHESSQTPQG